MPPQHHWIVPLFAALANLSLCLLVYLQDRRRPFYQTFAVLSLTLVMWNLDIFSLDYSTTAADALFWSRLFRTGMLLMPPTFLHCAMTFTDTKARSMRAVLLVNYVIASVLIVANAFDLLVAQVSRHTWGYYPQPLPLYSVHAASFVFNAVLASAVLAHAHRRSPSTRVRLQARFWLLALVSALPFGATNLLAVYGVPVYPLGSLASVAFTAVVAYAIVQYRLMDIDIVITKGAAYALVTFALIVPVFAIAVWMQQRAFGRIDGDFSMALLVSYILVAVLFPMLRSRTETRIGQSFFREKRAARAGLAEFASSIVRILDRGALIRELADTLTRALRLDRLAVFVQEPDAAYRLQYSIGPRPTAEEFLPDDAFVRAVAQQGETALREELEASRELSDPRVVRDVCRANGWEVVIPLMVSAKLVGLVNLGRKGNLDAFSAGDLEILNTLGAETAIALENARLNDELRRSQEVIQRAGRLSALGTLAAGIAHEVRNPLVSIQTFFQLAPDRLDDQEFLSTFLPMTAAEVKRISDLITELLSFARSSARALGPVNLDELAARVVTLLEPEATKHKLQLAHTRFQRVPPVHADGDQIKQVLFNLVLNAIQATAPGGTVAITGRAVQRRGAVFSQIQVRDTGTGISEDRLDDIFNPFFTTKDKGTGLGLAITQQIIAEHGGLISVDSTVGQGTSFFIELPALERAATPPGRAQGSAAAEPRPQPYGRKLAS